MSDEEHFFDTEEPTPRADVFDIEHNNLVQNERRPRRTPPNRLDLFHPGIPGGGTVAPSGQLSPGSDRSGKSTPKLSVDVGYGVQPQFNRPRPSPMMTLSPAVQEPMSPGSSGPTMLSDRRAKLTNLRMRMHVELVGEESNLVRPSSSSALLGIDRTGDNFDKLSLASWGKNLLRNSIDSTPSHNTLSPLDQQGSMQVVVPEDTISTKGVEAIRMPSESPLKTAPETKPKSGAYPDPQQASCSTAALYSLPPPSAGVALLKRYNTVAGDDRSSATTSSASSKSSSLDRQTSVTMGGVVGGLALSLSQSPGGPGDKIGSLGSIASDFGSGRSSKSNSLNRDGLPRDEAHATEMERRNSEIVDALAFELVPEASALPPDRLPDLPEEDQESTTNRSDSNSQQPSPNPAPQQPSVSSPPASDHPPDCTTQDPLVVTSASSRAPFVSCSSSFSSSTLTPVTVPSSPTPFMTPTADSQPASIAALDPGAKPRNSGDRPLGRPDVPNGHRQPDVVASCRLLKSAEGKMSVDNSGAGKTDGSAGSPIPPPRRRRTKDSLEDDVEESEVSIHVEPATPRVVLPKLDIKAARERSNTTPNHATTASVYRQYSGDGAEDRYMTGPTGTMRRKMSDPTSVKADPLSLHIMRITGNMDQSGDGNSDIESEDGVSDVSSEMGHKAESKEYLASAKVKTAKYKRLLSHTVRKTGMKIASKIKKTSDHYRHKNEARFESDDEDLNSEAGRVITVRASHHNKGPYNFDQLRLAQDLSGEHSGAIWCVKFSLCGRLMATAGQDNLIRIWVVKDAFDYFNNMRRKYNAETAASGGTTSSADIAMFAARAPSAASQLPRHRSPGSARAFRPSKDNSKQAGSVTPSATPTVHKSSWKHPLAPIQRDESFVSMSEASVVSGPSSSVCPNTAPSVIDEESWWPFRPEPFCFYRGHTADVLDVAWSKNYFLLSSSMDRTVRLWHVSRDECLCCFQHIDFVTAIAFLPRDDRYFLSGCLDGKLRLWNIPEKKVALWNEIDNGTLITAMTFVKNGKFVVVGTFDGRCIFYSTDNLKYFTQLDVKSSRRKNARGHKITGLEASPDKLLVTSNDSRIRLYDFTDLSLTCKYKGCSNGSSQIKAGFSPDGRYIICGSEDKSIYIWKTVMDVLTLSVRKDRNKMWESIRAHNAIVTAGVFAPKPELIFKQVDNARRQSGDVASLMGFSEADIDDTTSRISINSSVSSIRRPSLRKTKNNVGDVIVSADFTGCLYVFLNKPKIKTGSSIFLPSFAPR